MKQGLGIGLFAARARSSRPTACSSHDASTSAFLTQFSAILIPAWIALRQPAQPRARSSGWAASSCWSGVAILGHFDWRTLRFGRGEWETLLCSVFFMGQILWIGKKEFAGNRPPR
jgi:hypothetical protein